MVNETGLERVSTLDAEKIADALNANGFRNTLQRPFKGQTVYEMARALGIGRNTKQPLVDGIKPKFSPKSPSLVEMILDSKIKQSAKVQMLELLVQSPTV